MIYKYLITVLALLLSQSLFSQIQLNSSTNALRHGDFLCRVEVPYINEGQRGEESVWMLPVIPDDSPDYFQSILSNGDTIVIYEDGRIAIDEILKEEYKKEGGLYEDNTIVEVNDSENLSITVAFVDFMLGTGPEITIYTNQESSIIKDLKEEDRVKQTQKESVEKQKTITELSEQWKLWNHIYPGLCRRIMNYIGTYYATSIYDNNSKTTVANIVSDRKSAYSLFFHALSDHDRKANRNFGNTYQFYILK